MVRKTDAAVPPGTGAAPSAPRGWIARLGKGVLLLLMLAVLAGAAGMYTFRLCPCPHFEKIEPASAPVPPPVEPMPAPSWSSEQPPDKNAKK
jgi:hypothetical protein